MGQIIGLTGTIGSGKTTVGKYFEKLGAAIVDADVINTHLLQEDQNIIRKIVSSFGKEVLSEKGGVDKSKLAQIVWNSPSQKKALEEILHPAILKKCFLDAKSYFQKGKKIVIFEATLLIESGSYKKLDKLILVTSNPKIQKERFLNNPLKKNLHPFYDTILASQMPVLQKKKYADWVIDNSGTLESTQKQIQKIWNYI